MKDELGKRMKDQYENRTRMYLPRRTYTIIRLDGKAFHTFTRGLDRPFDKDLVWLMDSTTQYLCDQIQGCQFGYTQSDEISLLLTDFNEDGTQAWFDGNIQKMVSVAASMATMEFNDLMENMITVHGKTKFLKVDGGTKPAMFDARVFTIPDHVEVENYFVWRQKDAIRNSVSMLAQSLYSQKELNGKSQEDMKVLIERKGENWLSIDGGLKRGRMITQHKINSNDYEQSYSIYNERWPKCSFEFTINRDILRNNIPKIHPDLS